VQWQAQLQGSVFRQKSCTHVLIVGRAPGHFYRVFVGAVLHEGQVPDQHDAPRLLVSKKKMMNILHNFEHENTSVVLLPT
jgi:hypothetical protein